MTTEYGKIERIILAEYDPKQRDFLGRILQRLANNVERFSDGDGALDYAERNDYQLLVISTNCWETIDDAIKAIKKASNLEHQKIVVCANKMMPRQFSQLRTMGINHLFGNPMDPVYLFRIVHDLYGIVARRYLRINHSCDVFWGMGDSREIIGHTLDISRGGIRLVTDKKIEKGASLYWGIKLDDTTAIQARGEVLKVDTTSMAPKFIYGIAFVEIPSVTEIILDEAITCFVDEGADIADVSFTEENK